jgi:hypothetical protein
VTNERVPRRLFIGDWPIGVAKSGIYGEVRPGGVGPTRIDELCPSCDGPISTTGECRCSA